LTGAPRKHSADPKTTQKRIFYGGGDAKATKEDEEISRISKKNRKGGKLTSTTGVEPNPVGKYFGREITSKGRKGERIVKARSSIHARPINISSPMGINRHRYGRHPAWQKGKAHRAPCFQKDQGGKNQKSSLANIRQEFTTPSGNGERSDMIFEQTSSAVIG